MIKNMNKAVLRMALAITLAIAALDVQAQGLSLDEFVPPVQGGPTEPQGPVTETENVVLADSMQDGLGYAYQQILDEEGEGVRNVQTKTGLGVIATGISTYNTYQNPNATLLSKRSAYLKAFTKARTLLVKNMEGVENQCTTAIEDGGMSLDTGMDNAANEAGSVDETCSEVAKGVLSSYITYAVNDDVENTEVTISIASSTKTRSAIDRIGGAVVASSDPRKAFEHIAQEISLGIVPPMGAKLIQNPENGESIVIGFGSAIVRANDDRGMARRLRSMARQQAEMRANNALVSFLNGDQVYWTGGFDESQIESNQQFEIPVDESGQALDPVVLDQPKKQFMNIMTQTNAYSAVTKGKLPPGVQPKSFSSEDGHWMYTIAVYMPSLTAQAQQASSENRAASGHLDRAELDSSQGIRSNSGRTMRMEGGMTEGGANPQGPSGRVVLDNDF